MSGSDFGSYSGSMGATIGGGGASSSCDTLAFETALSSPKAVIVAKLLVGDTLDITVLSSGGVEIVAALYGADVVGGLVMHSERIKLCIGQGFTYVAEVRGIVGAKVTVFVRPA